MDATATTRTIRCAWALLLAALAWGALGAPEAGAAPNTGTKPPSIASRVKSFGELCETIGGGTAKVNYSYVDGKLESANASCKGGSESGYNCTFDADTTKCYQGPKQASVVPTGAPVDVVLTQEVAVADPGATTGEIVSVEPARSDAGSPDGTLAEAPVEATPAAPEPAVPVIEAEPAATELVEDDRE